MRKVLLQALILTLVSGVAFAGGGWVGNSPMIFAYQPTVIYSPTNYLAEGSEEKLVVPVWNSLLLPKGQQRIVFNYKNDDRVKSDFFGIEYDYAFTEKLTTFSLINWGYSLKAGNGLGSEWALYFGLLDGIYKSSTYGLTLGPGIGLGYSFSMPKWRATIKSSLSSQYSTEKSEWWTAKSKTTFDYTQWLGPKIGVGVGTSYYIGSSRRTSYDATLTTIRDGYDGFGDTSVYGVFRLSKNLEMTTIYNRDRGVGIGLSYSW